MSKNIISTESIEHSILFVRGQKVMLDSDLASLYGVETKNLNKAVRRNINRFPQDFMFQLSREEYGNLRFQFGTSSYGGRRYLPYVFTEHGALMAATVLNSSQAVEMSLVIVRTFVKLRQILASHKDLVRRLDELEKNYDKKFSIIFQAIKQLMEPPVERRRKKIGFNT